jgi:hypothetical protein
MPHINLDEVDVDGAIRETHAAVAADTRLDFLRKAGLAGGAAVGGGALLSALTAAPAGAASTTRPPSKPFGRGDTGILNYALTLEYLEAAFYNEATASRAITDPQTAAFLKVVTADENAHVKYLRKALGKHAVKKPKFDFKGIPANQDMFKATAQVLENTGVHAYFGQGPNIKSGKILVAAVSILTVEARHAGAIGLINGGSRDIAPDGPFDTPFSARKVLKAVEGTGFIVG